jgi:DNA-binding beta-propeller fold protein YncE
MKSVLLFFALTASLSIISFGQNPTPSDPKMFHLDSLNAPKNFKGSIRDLEWLVGNWRTERSANIFREDTYLPLEGRQITGVNRAIANNQVAYMNHIVIWQDGDTVKMNHKNFGAKLNLRGERSFRLINRDGDYFYFTGLTLHRVNHNLQEAYFDFGDQKQMQITNRVVLPNQHLNVMELYTEKELYPEGLAIDLLSNKIFLNSTNQNKIVSVDIDSKIQSDVKTKHLGTLRGTGLLIENKYLYALGNNNYDTSMKATHTSTLQIIDPRTNELIKSFEKTSRNHTLFNDITLTKKGIAYITNTSENAVYMINTKKGKSKFEEVIKSIEIESPNGISISDKNDKLYIATNKGIRVFDLNNKKLLAFNDTLTKGIDGLKFNNGKLYALQNGQLVSYQLDKKQETIISNQVLLKNHYTFDAPTSLSIVDNALYVLSNSQFGKRNRIESNMIDKSQLTNTYILTIKT